MYFSGLKAARHSVQQLKLVQIGVILLLIVQTIEAGYSFGFGQFTTPSTTTPSTTTPITTKSTTTKSITTTPFIFKKFETTTATTTTTTITAEMTTARVDKTSTTRVDKTTTAAPVDKTTTTRVENTTTAAPVDKTTTTRVDKTTTAAPVDRTTTTRVDKTTTAAPVDKTTTIRVDKSTGSDSYCSMCKSHVACKKNDTFGAACSDDAAIVKMDEGQKEEILKLHNKMRNKIAMGEMKEFAPAAKMPCFQWDDELARLAEINARSCVFKHDTCRATKKYPYAGQNIARRYNNIEYEDKDIALEEMITKWFSENKDADMSYIKSYHNQKKGKQIGHFTVMINDKNNAVGCAYSMYQAKGNYYRYLVCNYGFTNVLTRPVYENGATGSKCVKRHHIYKGLCSVDQVVIPVP